MNFFEKEMRSFFECSDIIQEAKFSGKTMLGKLDDDLRVKMEFVSRGVVGCYPTLQMSIINRTQGLVDKTDFYFSDIIGYYQHHSHASPTAFHMCDEYGKPRWITPITPEQKEAIADRVLEFVEMYQDQSMSFGSLTM